MACAVGFEDSNSHTESKIGNDTELVMHCVSCFSDEAYNILTGCLHSLCRECSSSLKTIDKLQNSMEFQCPACKEWNTKVVTNSILCKSDSTQTSPKCNWCDDNGEQTKSIGNCKECDVWLCEECLKGHNRMPPLRSHTITMLPKIDTQDSLRCEIHPHEALECFCEACNMLTCRDCQLSVHRDHGSHRWVGEKANLLTSPLEEAIRRLETCQESLTEASQFASAASSSTKDDSFLGSVEQTRLAIEARASSLILRIRSHTDALLKELNSKCRDNVEKLVASEALMRELKDRIQFVLNFAKRLIKHKNTDPASLVQLFNAVQLRIQILRSQADRIVMDAPPSADVNEANLEDMEAYPTTWRKSTIGWRTTANTRALFMANWNPEELERHSGMVTWLPATNLCEATKNTTDAVGDKLEHPPTNGDDNREFLDSLAVMDSRQRNSDFGCVSGVGCAICFGAGLLAHCGKCRRAYHLDCHLPRLTSISLVPGWICGLCVDQDAASAARIEQSDGTGLSHMDYLAGCRILMGLLVHSEAVHFTTSVCPACSVPLLTPGLSVPHCPAGHLYHRLAELRLQLEEAASTANGGPHHLDDLEDHDQPPAGGRIPLTRLDDWLVEVDKFWSDAADEDNHVKGVTKGCLRAARRLRASLASLIRMHRPESQLALSTLDTDTSLDGDGGTSINESTTGIGGATDTEANINVFQVGGQ